MRVLFFVEGYTDIRFVAGLSEVCELTMMVPARQYRESQLNTRVMQSGAKVRVTEIPGGTAFSVPIARSPLARGCDFDVILSQEFLRSLNATVIGRSGHAGGHLYGHFPGRVRPVPARRVKSEPDDVGMRDGDSYVDDRQRATRSTMPGNGTLSSRCGRTVLPA